MFTTGINNICKNHRRTTEYIIFQLHFFINRNIILYLDKISNFYLISYTNILSQSAFFTNYYSRMNMREMSYLSSLTNFYIIINKTALVNKNISLIHTSSNLYFQSYFIIMFTLRMENIILFKDLSSTHNSFLILRNEVTKDLVPSRIRIN